MSAAFHDWWSAHRLEFYGSGILLGIVALGLLVVFIAELIRTRPRK